MDWMRLAGRWRAAAVVWRRLQAAVASFLVIVGLCALAYGVVYWWKGFPYPLAMLFACVALGCVPLGAGLYLRVPATAATLALSAASFTVAGVLQIVWLWTTPGFPLLLLLLAWGGAAHSGVRFRRLRKNRGE
jgi:hypothetical protein